MIAPADLFFTDLHGEDKAFIYLLRTGCGILRERAKECFSHRLSEDTIDRLLYLVAFPEEYSVGESEYLAHLRNLAKCFGISSCVMSEGFVTLADNVSRALVNKVFVLGDVWDRGPRPDKIMDEIIHRGGVRMVWGNHDIMWMGASRGSEICCLNVLRISMRYNSFEMLTEGYGIDLEGLKEFACEVYAGDDCKSFIPRSAGEFVAPGISVSDAAKMHKATAIIQFKLICALMARHPEYPFEEKPFLDCLDLESGYAEYLGKRYELADKNFPTLNKSCLYQLTDGERQVLDCLTRSFKSSKKLSEHISYILENGSLYHIDSKVLMYHGLLPMSDGGEFVKIGFVGNLTGRELFDYCEKKLREILSLEAEDESQERFDFIEYLWQCEQSVLNGKSYHTAETFLKYFAAGERENIERKDFYYTFIADKSADTEILKQFGLRQDESIILTGHMPVKSGEKPGYAGSKLLIIDGGLSRNYEKTTGKGGYVFMRREGKHYLIEAQPYSVYSRNKVFKVETFVRELDF